MQTILNEYKRQGEKAKMQYDALNKKTVEKIKTYDPRLRCWTYQKLQTDPNAINFVRKEQNQKKENFKKLKLKPLNSETVKPVKVAKPPKPKKVKVKKVTLYDKIKKLLIEGKTHEDIETELGCSRGIVQVYSAKIRRENPKIKLVKKTDVKLTKLQKEILPYLEQGLTFKKIAETLKKPPSTIAESFKALEKKRDPKWVKNVKKMQQEMRDANFRAYLENPSPRKKYNNPPTENEINIIRLHKEGKTNAEIKKELNLSSHTLIHFHLKKLKK